VRYSEPRGSNLLWFLAIAHNPRVSVLIPAYNEASFIRFAVESVLAQTFADFELVVINNASTDGTSAVVRSIPDSRIRLIDEAQHVGPAANFNRALHQARGEFLKFLPADDIIYPACLEKQVAVLTDPAQAAVALVSCPRHVIDEAGRSVRRARMRWHGRVAGAEAIRRAVRAGANIIGEPGFVMLRRSNLAQTGGFNESLPFMLDMDLWCRVLLHGDLFMLGEPLGEFRISRKSLSFVMLGNQARQFHKFIDDVRAKREYPLTWWDAKRGKVNSILREIVRWGAYRYYLRSQLDVANAPP
jgi:glycosyltransferase involved in cell wall biosynthesis